MWIDYALHIAELRAAMALVVLFTRYPVPGGCWLRQCGSRRREVMPAWQLVLTRHSEAHPRPESISTWDLKHKQVDRLEPRLSPG
jgi:hypothetical protein